MINLSLPMARRRAANDDHPSAGGRRSNIVPGAEALVHPAARRRGQAIRRRPEQALHGCRPGARSMAADRAWRIGRGHHLAPHAANPWMAAVEGMLDRRRTSTAGRRCPPTTIMPYDNGNPYDTLLRKSACVVRDGGQRLHDPRRLRAPARRPSLSSIARAIWSLRRTLAAADYSAFIRRAVRSACINRGLGIASASGLDARPGLAARAAASCAIPQATCRRIHASVYRMNAGAARVTFFDPQSTVPGRASRRDDLIGALTELRRGGGPLPGACMTGSAAHRRGIEQRRPGLRPERRAPGTPR